MNFFGIGSYGDGSGSLLSACWCLVPNACRSLGRDPWAHSLKVFSPAFREFEEEIPAKAIE